MSKTNIDDLCPWEKKPFELLFHAETHYQSSSDYDKRMSYINFDNSIEVSIYTFMHWNTKPKGSKKYTKQDLDNVKSSFFKKLEKFQEYIQKEGLPINSDKNKINYYHEQRNNLYHDAHLITPDTTELNEIRKISLWIFSTLFNVPKIQDLLNSAISKSEKSFPQIPEEFITPKIEGIHKIHETPLFVASILGQWDENSQGDNEIIKEITNGF